MASTVIEPSSLLEAIDAQAPCGPDLDAEYDPEFMNFVARAEGLLPDSYFLFDRTAIKFDAEYDVIADLLDRSRDLRLLVIYTKLSILNRDLDGFGRGLSCIEALLGQRWPDVHPKPDDGDVALRAAILQSLDDLPHIVLPLQHLPLAESRRYGAVRYRHELLANGEASPREGEEFLDRQTIDLALSEADLDEMKATLASLSARKGTVDAIHATWIAQAGHDNAVVLERVDTLLGRMIAFLGAAVARRDPTHALTTAAPAAVPGHAAASASASSGPAPGPIGSVREAAAALAAIGLYFENREPSSPALLLVRQAEQLIGKSFLEIMQILLPQQVDQAAIQIGGEEFFDFPLERLSAFDRPGGSDGSGADGGGEDWSAEPERSEDSHGEEAGEASAEGEGAGAGTEGPAQGAWQAPASQRPVVSSRHQATALLQQVGTYFRTTEPTSPIPYLTERARYFAERDFLSLLRDVLPESTLKKIGGQD